MEMDDELERLEREGLEILNRVIEEYNPSHVFALCSGGHDSLTCTHIASRHPRFSGVVHVDTGIKVIDEGYEPENFVQRVCDQFGWNLRVYRASENTFEDGSPDPQIYENLVFQGAHKKGFPFAGFPGSSLHLVMYSRLKERQVSRLIRDCKQHAGDRIVLVTGVRRHESQRRWESLSKWGEINVDGARVWVAPLIDWEAHHCCAYMKKYGIPRNPVKDLIHISGECLCGSFAKPKELELIEACLPETGAYLRDLEKRHREAGYPWGWDESPPDWWQAYTSGKMLYSEFEAEEPVQMLCTSCIDRHEMYEQHYELKEKPMTTTAIATTTFDNMFTFRFPAIKGTQAQKEFYTSMVPLGILARLAMFDESELPPELRAQRPLTPSRIPQIAQYILKNPNSYTFDSISIAVDSDAVFESMDATAQMGALSLPVNSLFRIIDGQHRYHGIKAALEENPALAGETISVIFFCGCDLPTIQQKFSDLNMFGKTVSKSLGIAYNHRDDRAIITHEVQRGNEVFRRLTELEKNSIPARSSKLFCLNHLFEATNALLVNQKDKSTDERVQIAIAYWNAVVANIPEWQRVMDGSVAASEVRKEFIHSLGVSLVALGKVGADLIKRENYPDKLAKLSKIDWHRTNPDWEGRVLFGGSVKKNAAVANAIAEYIKEKIKK